MFRYNKKFSPLEVAILELLFRAVPAETAKSLRKQVSLIAKIQRINHGKEVDLYFQHKDDNSGVVNDRIMPDIGEFKFATVKFTIPCDNIKMSVDFWLVHGYLFSLNFNSSPKKYMRKDVIEIQEVLLHKGSGQVHNGYLKMRTKLVEFLKKSRRFDVNDWSIFEETDIATIKFGDEEYFVFAKHYNDSLFLLIRCSDSMLYYVEHEDVMPKLLGDELSNLISQ